MLFAYSAQCQMSNRKAYFISRLLNQGKKKNCLKSKNIQNMETEQQTHQN